MTDRLIVKFTVQIEPKDYKQIAEENKVIFRRAAIFRSPNREDTILVFNE